MTTPPLAGHSLPLLLLEQGPACHWVLNREGVFEQAFGDSCSLFRRRVKELVGRRLHEVLPPPAADVWARELARAFAGETSFVAEPLEPGRPAFAVTLFPLRSAGGEVEFAGGFAVDITQAQVTEQQLRSTALQVLSAQEAEHARLARFLHDEVGQSLTAAGMRLDILRMDLEATVPGISARTAEIQSLLEGVVDRIRDLSYELNPNIVERAGFHSALDRLAGRYRRTFPGTLRLMADSSLRFPSEIGSALYKIAQEAVENAIQHAACSQIEVLVKTAQAGPTLEVRDNGCGFSAAANRRKLGLLLMQHYASQAGLRLTIDSQEGKGTTVRAVWERDPSHKS
jgi:signal transduction histidine kinase